MWLNVVWEELHQTKPEWFTEDIVANLPPDLIPHAKHEVFQEEIDSFKKSSVRRRSSVFIVKEFIAGRAST